MIKSHHEYLVIANLMGHFFFNCGGREREEGNIVQLEALGLDEDNLKGAYIRDESSYENETIMTYTSFFMVNKVLDSGRLKEFDEPHLLLQNRWGHFYRLVQQTGSLTSAHLAQAARQAFLRRHQPQASYAVPDSSRSYLSSYIPITGFTDLQLESCV